ncbi:hypothetical protein [Streptomyces sp. NPDC006285]|uniref:hypothetical protein n=1 Tax=Streptomyces sp. NPDC006285 TaxID=3364742 RepID=UPI0036B5E599
MRHLFRDDSHGRRASHRAHATGTSRSESRRPRRARTKRCGTIRPAVSADVLDNSHGGFERAGRGGRLQRALLVDGDGASP